MPQYYPTLLVNGQKRTIYFNFNVALQIRFSSILSHVLFCDCIKPVGKCHTYSYNCVARLPSYNWHLYRSVGVCSYHGMHAMYTASNKCETHTFMQYSPIDVNDMPPNLVSYNHT